MTFTWIERNMQRDKEVNEYLVSSGWKVLRFWSKEIKTDLEKCLADIVEQVNKRKFPKKG